MKLKRSTSVVWRDYGGKILVLHLSKGRMYLLESVGARIWLLLDGNFDTNQIVDRITEEYDVTRSQVENDLALFIRELLIEGLITIGECSP